MNQNHTVKIAAIADLHCTKRSQGVYQAMFAKVQEEADILVLCGDLTDYGLPEEAHVLVKELAPIRIPIVAVLGNHDYESGKEEELKEIFCSAGIKILDGEATEINDVGFAGVKGFGGGFGRRTLGAWGEKSIKALVHEAVDEALKLESALARLTTSQKVVLMHYAPIATTIDGEPTEIYPFLGTSRLEEPLVRYPVDVVFHGHAHKGTLEGRTTNGVPVYNVAMPLLKMRFPDHPPWRVVELTPQVELEPEVTDFQI